VPLLPILVRLLERGGIQGIPVTDGRVHAALDDGRLVALPRFSRSPVKVCRRRRNARPVPPQLCSCSW
jgi:hypothetical protein